MISKLLPCKLCVKALDYENYTNLPAKAQNDLIENFPIEELLETFKPIFRCLPLYSSTSIPSANYSKDWSKISIKTREAAHWSCECCRVQLKQKIGKGLLHVHHKDRIRGNNRPSNLKVLCAECHKKQPFHEHMNLPNHDVNFIKNRRIEQGLKPKCVRCN